MMKIRRNIWPKSVQDLAVMSYTLFMLPATLYFEVFIVLPAIMNTFWYILHIMLALFIFFNVVGNYVATILCDTSIKGRMLNAELQEGWKFCAVCESLTPPRSYHCSTCKVCILKRDHHCLFTGCCIGHHNMRYFMVFVFYVFASMLYATVLNTAFLQTLNLNFVWSWSLIPKIMFPLVWLMYMYDTEYMYLFFVVLLTVNMLFAGAILMFHWKQIVKGQITHEGRKKVSLYDYGRDENIKIALGNDWKMIWIWPTYKSELKHDGIHWVTTECVKDK